MDLHTLLATQSSMFRIVRSKARTRLCMWMVYSRATTSAMALRWVLPPVFFPVLVDISAGGISLGNSKSVEEEEKTSGKERRRCFYARGILGGASYLRIVSWWSIGVEDELRSMTEIRNFCVRTGRVGSGGRAATNHALTKFLRVEITCNHSEVRTSCKLDHGADAIHVSICECVFTVNHCCFS